ncbi:hypothetical protein AAFC00_005775 [Neodothiora populina]|uniref:Uncharacterized protein n=1 Tax=Neodothiora populina TaxID=2781224 RepID=A0ABR3P651_9PEZI
MRNFALIPAFIGLALAAPRPQDIALDEIEALPTVAVVTPALVVASQSASVLPLESQLAAASSAIVADPAIGTPAAEKRNLAERDGTCAPYPKGAGPVPSPDTPDAFLNSKTLNDMSEYAVVPDGYKEEFKGAKASLSAYSYMGLYTLDSYDTLSCANRCDRAQGCVAFNVYIERDPSLDANNQKCPNPPSTINYKCTLWGAPVCDDQATNFGQYRAQFKVVITGSNAYNKNTPPAAVDGFLGPSALGGAIRAPPETGSYLTYQYFPFSQKQGYTPQTCAAGCKTITEENSKNPKKDGSYQSCVQFNSYVLSKNGTPLGLYCSFYADVWGPQYADNYGQYRGSDRYTVSQSYSYCLEQ